MRDATWLYAVAADPDLPAGLSGVAGEPVRPLSCGDLTAVVGTVDLAEFGEEPLRRALHEPQRVELLARAHHEVVQAVTGRSAAVPFRLATIYLGDDRVREFVAGNRAVLGAVLRRVAGHAEWGVKAYVDPAEPAVAAGAPGRRERSGTAYLMRRREQLTRRETEWARAVARGDEIHAALSEVATGSVRHPVPVEQQSPGPGRLVLHAAYLIRSAVADRFAESVRALTATGARLQVTGPWAAYSFTGLTPEQDGPTTT